MRRGVSGRIDAIAGQYVTDRSPGLALLVGRGGRVLLSKGYGLADLAKRVPVTAGTRFLVASVSKAFTATAVMLLRNRSRLDVWKDRVTVRHLLTHTGGVPEYLTREFWEEARSRNFDQAGSGGTLGYAAHLCRFASEELCIVLLSNQQELAPPRQVDPPVPEAWPVEKEGDYADPLTAANGAVYNLTRAGKEPAARAG